MKKILILASCIVFLMAGVADAYFYLETGVAGSRNVTLTDPGNASIGSTAGQFTVDYGPTQATAVSYQAFCVDYAVINWGLSSAPFFMINVPDEVPYHEAAFIFNKYANIAPGLAQVAIWEVIFEGLSGGTTTGTLEDLKTLGKFHLTGYSDAELTIAAGYVLDAITNGQNADLSGFMLLVSSSVTDFYGKEDQDFIVRVPEPMTMILFGLGLVGLAVLTRKE